jgi:hypothetical protein
MSLPAQEFHLRRSAQLKIDIIDFVEASVCFRNGNRFRIDINANHASGAEAFRRESENSAPGSKVGKRPAILPFASQALEETEGHCRRCMFSCSKRRGSGNDEELRFIDPRCNVRCPQRMWSSAVSVDPLRTAAARALRPPLASGDDQPCANPERFPLFRLRESLEPIARQFLGASAKFFDEFSGIIA